MLFLMQQRRKYREYLDDDKIMALLHLRLNGGNVLLTARKTGIPRSTIRRWKEHEGIKRAVAQIGRQAVKMMEETAATVAKQRLEELEQDGYGDSYSASLHSSLRIFDVLAVTQGFRVPRKRRRDYGYPKPRAAHNEHPQD